MTKGLLVFLCPALGLLLPSSIVSAQVFTGMTYDTRYGLNIENEGNLNRVDQFIRDNKADTITCPLPYRVVEEDHTSNHYPVIASFRMK